MKDCSTGVVLKGSWLDLVVVIWLIQKALPQVGKVILEVNRLSGTIPQNMNGLFEKVPGLANSKSCQNTIVNKIRMVNSSHFFIITILNFGQEYVLPYF